MSDFQIGLLVIGALIVIGVYGFGFWQQRQYRRKFRGVFNVNRTDVLTKDPTVKIAVPDVACAIETPLEEISERDEIPLENEAVMPVIEELIEHKTNFVADGVCDLIEPSRDYIATFNLNFPQNCDFLATVWDRRFVFGKSIVVCALNVNNLNWERVVQESRATYTTFRVSMQLVDRNGSASEAKLTSFYELMKQIAQQLAIEVDIADVASTLKRAIALDEFCAKSDQIIGINITLKDGKPMFASEISEIVHLLDFSLQADGKFHLLDENGQTRFVLADSSEAPFQHHTLNQTRVHSLTLLLDVPRVTSPVLRFEQMALLAQELATELKGLVVDDNGRELKPQSITQIQAQIAEIEADMSAGGIVPGSAQARRLFS